MRFGKALSRSVMMTIGMANTIAAAFGAVADPTCVNSAAEIMRSVNSKRPSMSVDRCMADIKISS